MRKLHILGFVVFAVFAGSAGVASSAFALESTWLVNGVKPAAPVAATTESVGNLLLEDMSALGAAVECSSVASTGTIGAGPADHVSTVTFILGDCKFETAGPCTSLVAVKAIDLPWTTAITLSAGAFIDTITEDGAGAPGYLIECKTALGVVDDACTKASATSTLTNSGTGVDGAFNTTETGNCSIGGTNEALIAGTVFNQVAGSTLTVGEG